LTYRESLRDIEVNLRAQAKRLYHMGFRCQTISRNTLANANATRPWQIYADFAQHLIGMARPLYANEPLGIDLDSTVYAFDSSTIDLVPVGVRVGAVSLDQGRHQAAHPAGFAGRYPQLHPHQRWQDCTRSTCWICCFRAGRVLPDGSGLSGLRKAVRLHQAGAFFVTRAKSNFNAARVLGTLDRSDGVICDQRLRWVAFMPRKDYPEHMRRIRFKDDDSGKTLVFLTNNTALPALTICRLVQATLAGRAVLQVDQAAPAHQEIHRHQRERRQDTDLVRCGHLRADRHRQETLASCRITVCTKSYKS
jgi:hypothetical protein